MCLLWGCLSPPKACVLVNGLSSEWLTPIVVARKCVAKEEPGLRRENTRFIRENFQDTVNIGEQTLWDS